MTMRTPNGAVTAKKRIEAPQKFIARHPLWFMVIGPGLIAVALHYFAEHKLVDNSIAELVEPFGFVIGCLLAVYAESSLTRSAVEDQMSLAHQQVTEVLEEAADLRERLRGALAQPAEKLDISIANFSNFLTYVPLYVAAGCGFFEEQRIKASIVSYQDDLGAVKALANRSDYFAITDPMFAFHEDIVGRDVLVISPFINKAAVWALSRLNVKELLTTNLSGVVGRNLKVATFEEATTAYRLTEELTRRMAASGNLSDPIYEVSRDPSDSIGSFFSKHFVEDIDLLKGFDILVFSQPETSYLKSKIPGTEVYSIHDLLYQGRSFAFTSILARGRTVRVERELVKRFLRAMQHAQTLVYSLPVLPSEEGAIEAMIAAEPWAKTVAAVRDNIDTCYPGNISSNISNPEIARLIEALRSRSYFTADPTDRSAFDEGLRKACALSRGTKEADIRHRTLSPEDLRELMY